MNTQIKVQHSTEARLQPWGMDAHGAQSSTLIELLLNKSWKHLLSLFSDSE